MAKKFIVNCLRINGLGKRKFESGDKVTESDFPRGAAFKLLKSGHLKLAAGENLTEEEKEQSVDIQDMGREDFTGQHVDDNEEETGSEKTDKPVKKEFKEISEDELKEYLLSKEIEFNPAAKKKVLYDLYLGN